jgi:hypothetical protein
MEKTFFEKTVEKWVFIKSILFQLLLPILVLLGIVFSIVIIVFGIKSN